MMTVPQQSNGERENGPRVIARGFSLIEIMFVILIGSILTAVAIPQVKSGVYRYRLQSAIATSTWAIQSTRYQALMKGYPYQVVFSTATNSYQIQNSPLDNGIYANVGTSIPLSASTVALSADTTLQFKQNGFVTPTVGASNFFITYQGLCQKVTVSNYANISLTTIAPTCP